MPEPTSPGTGATPVLTLAERTRPDFLDMGQYFAYFRERLPLGHPKLDAMVEFARAIGAEFQCETAERTFSGFFHAMTFRISIEPMAISECFEFQERFKPDMDGRIEILE
jgi:hypothetical protein